jgi:hypothetical protein
MHTIPEEFALQSLPVHFLLLQVRAITSFPYCSCLSAGQQAFKLKAATWYVVPQQSCGVDIDLLVAAVIGLELVAGLYQLQMIVGRASFV